MRPVIGITVSFEEPDPQRALFRGKPLQYLEVGMLAAVRASGATPILLPALGDDEAAHDLVACCDGLLLSGGTDVAPQSYGQVPLDPAWSGDIERDLYECALLHAALSAGKPVLGICRGCQLLSVAHGGTMFQDIATQCEGAVPHRDPDVYDRLEHDVEVVDATRLARVLGAGMRRINTVHHQAIRDVGSTLRVSARATDG
ncbi:MAG: gamma-glutamyl-gamma-aminobutyrate hydrolase family protein, partial [Planctomycetes bacterium]|nr:gamma-glutamyl-gamma-aminobutyrate hydrolase family protein [Planctomycetota bacterium]